jgi:hypothetical protein
MPLRHGHTNANGFNEDVFAVLKQHNAALCIAEDEDPPQRVTADFA